MASLPADQHNRDRNFCSDVIYTTVAPASAFSQQLSHISRHRRAGHHWAKTLRGFLLLTPAEIAEWRETVATVNAGCIVLSQS